MSEIYKRTGMCGSFTAGNIGEKAVINGWVAKRRNLGGLVFCDIRDKTGIVQVVFDENVPKALFEKADSLRSEYVVGVKGTVRRRESVNPDIPTGDVEILAEDMVVYATSETPPIYVKDDESHAILSAAFEAGDPVCIKVYDNKRKKGMFGGLAVITDYPIEAPYDDSVTYSLTFSGMGKLTDLTVDVPESDVLPS